MPSYIHQIQTLNPDVSFTQEQLLEIMKKSCAGGDRKTERLLHRLYSQSGIERRHCVLGGLSNDADTPSEHFYNAETDTPLTPTTQTRNEIYAHAIQLLAPKLACSLVADSDFSAQEITHVITVSCTGFFQPGPDFLVTKALGLNPATERYHIGFMGCYAAFPALRMADTICKANPDAVVLVMSMELCTLHLQWHAELDDLLAGSVFADGLGAAIVSARTPKPGRKPLRIEQFSSAIAPAEDTDMAWTIGDTGFRMRLSLYVPQIIEAQISGAITPLLELGNIAQDNVDHWAVHPGGRAILDKVESGLKLTPENLAPSRETLRNFGNMSSATIFFVLQEILNSAQPDESIVAMSFGPGLTVESALLTRVG
ncbi:MAG: type III polyketide synthase [Armatimonas sp.]